ncbi:hypothetical protein AVEN_62881-1, partial [Araneus ventricosus]
MEGRGRGGPSGKSSALGPEGPWGQKGLGPGSTEDPP